MKNIEELKQWYDDNVPLFNNLIKKAQLIIEESIKEEGITINSITGRAKEKKSFCDKALKDKYTDPVNQIKDVAGLRIITYINSDVERISKLIEKEFDIDKSNSVDKGELLGTNKVGYRSVHYVVKLKDDRIKLTEYKHFENLYFEIQIRTLLQHAWSEIEHDKNYKFSGVLPQEIQREFALLAGTLELIDMHFEDISKKFDNYSNDIIKKVEIGNLNEISIDSASIIGYLKNKFSLQIKKGIINPILVDDTIIIEELNLFGINTMKDLDDLMKIDMTISDEFLGNFVSILRLYMIKSDLKKYFENSWKKHWGGITRASYDLYKKNDIDVDYIVNTYNIVTFQ
ncbi:hypothetical protein GNF80_02860 [Clostridium perfringens]|nr:hypothetical protein [Clostridium perfringens]